MKEFFQQTVQNPMFPIIGALLGFMGIVLAISFYLRNRRVNKIKFDSVNYSLVEGLSAALDGLEVKFHGKTEEKITVTKLAFWNGGTETIRSSDFTDDLLRISPSDKCNLLDYRIINFSESTNKLTLGQIKSEEDSNILTFELSFDYLDPQDGGVVQIVHNGSNRNRFKMIGTIKGDCSIKQAESPVLRMKKAFPIIGPLVRSRLFGWFGAISYIVFACIGLLAPLVCNASPWLYLAVPFGLIGCWGMIYAYALGQVPQKFMRELINRPQSC